MSDRNYGYSYEPVGTGAAVNQQTYRMEAGQLWRQYIIAGIANIAIAAVGFSMGWTSPVNLILKSSQYSPLPEPVTRSQESWIGSLLSVGAMMGPFIGGFFSAKIGRKRGMLSSMVPFMLGWVLIAAAQTVSYIYVGRVFWGIAVGMLYTITPMYCAEIATDDCRGALGSFTQVFVTLGFLMIYIVGPFMSYHSIAYVGISLAAIFVSTFFFMPESPIYHLTKNDPDSAAKCLATIRGKSRAGVQAEIDQMYADTQAALEKTATIADVFRGGNFKAFYIVCALLFFQQFSGINAVLFYMTNIFGAAGSQLDPAIATIIIGTVQVGASALTPFMVDRLGRRILLLISSGGAAIGLAFLGMYFMLSQHTTDTTLESIAFLPVLCLVVFIVMYCWGLGPLPWAIMGELFPIEVKAIASPIATAFCWFLSFVITRYFQPVANAVGMGVAFWIFGVCCVVSFFFTLFIIPETKGKSFREIQDMLAGKSSKPGKGKT